MLAQAAQRGCGCPVPGGVQGQVGWGLGQPGLVLNGEIGGPACGRQLELDDDWGPFQLKPFYDSVLYHGRCCCLMSYFSQLRQGCRQSLPSELHCKMLFL